MPKLSDKNQLPNTILTDEEARNIQELLVSSNSKMKIGNNESLDAFKKLFRRKVFSTDQHDEKKISNS